MGSYISEVRADSPIYYIPLDETAGTTMNDYSGNAHSFVLQNSTQNQTPVMPSGGRSVLLGATDADRVTRTWEAAADSTSFSVEAWVNMTSVTGRHAIASRDWNSPRGWSFYILGGQLSAFDTGGNDRLGSSTLVTGTSYHVGMAYDGVGHTVKLYLNGVQDGSYSSITMANSFGSYDFFWGCSRAGTTGTVTSSAFFPLQGKLDEVAYYGTALPAARWLAHYNAGADTHKITGWGSPAYAA